MKRGSGSSVEVEVQQLRDGNDFHLFHFYGHILVIVIKDQKHGRDLSELPIFTRHLGKVWVRKRMGPDFYGNPSKCLALK